MLQLAFDYSQLDTETRDIIEIESNELDHHMEQGNQHYIQAGRCLARIRDTLRYKRPGFVDYLASKNIPQNTAYKLIHIGEMFTDSVNISSIEALALLAAPSTPEPIRQEMIDRAQNGETITYSTVRESIEVNKLIDPIVVYGGNGPAQPVVDEYTQLQREESIQDAHLDAALADESKPVCQNCGLVYDGQICPDCNPKPILEQITSQVDGCKVIFGDANRMDLTQFEQYGVIVADPPWPYRITIKQGTTEGQYDSMTDEDLKSIPVPQLALPDSVLLLWGTWPKLPEALALMEAWGFEYVTGFPWVKTTSGNNIDYGVGYWVRGVSEYVLIGRRGNVDIEPLRKKGFMGLLAENDNGSPALWLGGPNLQHSRKPDSIHQLAEFLPGPYLELFARRPRHGWTVFGNDQSLYQKTLA